MSLSLAAQGVFSPEPSLTNRNGRFTVMTWSKPSSEARQPSKRDTCCSQYQLEKVAEECPCNNSHGVAQGASTDNEPDAEPDVLSSRNEERPEENARREEEKKQGAEIRNLTAQLMDARDQVERLKTKHSEHVAQAALERKSRKDAEEQVTKLQAKCQVQEQGLSKLRSEKLQLGKRNDILEKTVKQLRKTGLQQSVSCDMDRLVSQLADAECAPLKRCAADEKAALRKRLLLKWHPDKQPSAEHSKFATLVVQDMQNNPLWQD
jgi:hypothetical protein